MHPSDPPDRSRLSYASLRLFVDVIMNPHVNVCELSAHARLSKKSVPCMAICRFLQSGRGFCQSLMPTANVSVSGVASGYLKMDIRASSALSV